MCLKLQSEKLNHLEAAKVYQPAKSSTFCLLLDLILMFDGSKLKLKVFAAFTRSTF
jgi:hypothetical protein